VHVTRTLAEFLVRSRWEDLPTQVRHQAKRSLLNYFGTALGGSRDGATQRAVQVLSPFAGKPEASLIGRTERMDALNAAFVNAISANVFDFDDNHHNTIIHPTAPVAPALFALAERQRVSGADLLHAFVLGVEVECRVGNAVSPGHYKRGWHITSTCGVFGAAAAVAKLLSLDAERTGWAIGSASAQSSGLVETLGSMAKSVGVGGAARGGILAVLLAQTGFTGPDEPIAGPRGFARVMGDAPNFAAITEGLGESWEIMTNNPKPYPCGVVLNPVVDACLELRPRVAPSLDRIARIRVEGHPLLRERTDRPNVTTGREAQVSAQHSVAAVLLHGAAGVPQYADSCVKSPDILALRRKVEVIDTSGIPVEAARVTIVLTNGESLAFFVEHARGTPGRPLTDAEIEGKVRALADYGCPGCDPGPIIEAMWSLDGAQDAGAVMKLARPG
jgi:2-methylcitrate dehydratase PrpD